MARRTESMVFVIDVDQKTGERRLRSFETQSGRTFNNVKENAKGATGSVAGLTGAVKGLGLAAAATAAAMGAIRFGQQAVRTYADYELAEKRRAAALERSGLLTEKNIELTNDLVLGLTFGSNATKKSVENYFALALSMGASIEKSEQLVKAALDMSAALGTDQQQAVRQVMRTLGGYAGELAEVVPEIKSLTREQLLAGEAADLLASKFGGAALTEVDSLSGATNNLNTALEEATATTGQIIAEFLGLQSAAERATEKITSLNEKLKTLAALTDENNAQIIAVDQQLREMADSAGLYRTAFSAIVEEMNRAKDAGAGMDDIQRLIDEAKASAKDAGDEIFIFRTRLTELADEMETAAENQRMLKYHTDEYKAAVERKKEATEELNRVLREQKQLEQEMAAFQKQFNEDNASFLNPEPTDSQTFNDDEALDASLEAAMEGLGGLEESAISVDEAWRSMANTLGTSVDTLQMVSGIAKQVAQGFSMVAGAQLAAALAGEKSNASLGKVLQSMSAQALATAVFELAAGVAASSGPWGAAIFGNPAAHFKAAAVFGTAGAALGVAARVAGGGGGGSGGGGRDAGGDFNNDSPNDLVSNPPKAQYTVIYENTAVVGMTLEEMANQTAEAIERANSRTGAD